MSIYKVECSASRVYLAKKKTITIGSCRKPCRRLKCYFRGKINSEIRIKIKFMMISQSFTRFLSFQLKKKKDRSTFA